MTASQAKAGQTGRARGVLPVVVIAAWLSFTAVAMWALNPITVVDLVAGCTAPRSK